MRCLPFVVLLAAAACDGSIQTQTGGAGGIGGAGGSSSGGAAGTGGASSGGAGGSGSSAGGGGAGGDPCAACTGPGEVCAGGVCSVDCTDPASVPCDPGTVCNVSDAAPGECVPEGSACLVAGAAAPCGNVSCGAGTLCDPVPLACTPDLPCTGMNEKGGTYFGVGCPCMRPPPACAAADLAALNDAAFVFGLVDLDFDLKCGAWAVTVVSGPDFLRHVATDGTMSAVTGVANLNMGEVAAAQGVDGTFGGDAIDVALTYNCCVNCGCQANPPQGVAWYDEVQGTLPMLIPSPAFTSGPGPFGSGYLDTGPQGLTLGLNHDVFVGNVNQSGDVYQVSLDTLMATFVADLGARVYAAAPFDGNRILVATEAGDIVFVYPASGLVTPFAAGVLDVTSMARDPYLGHVYVATKGGAIHAYSSKGADLGLFAQGAASGRISLARDNYLYHLDVAPVAAATVERFPLPAGL